MILGAASVQISFYSMTGQEIKWKAAKNLASDHDGFKVALSGGVQVMFVSILILALAFTFSQPLYFITQALVGAGAKLFRRGHLYSIAPSKEAVSMSQQSASEGNEDHSISASRRSMETGQLLPDDGVGQIRHLWKKRLLFLTPFSVICILLFVRPSHFPYAHMSQSLPYTLAEIWYSFDGDMCEAGHFEEVPPFPLQDLIAEEFWEPAHGTYVGWRPTGNVTAKYLADHYASRPAWLPAIPMQGLERW